MGTSDSSEVLLLPAGREISRRALWLLRLVFGGVALVVLVAVGPTAIAGEWQTTLRLGARVLALLLLYRVGLRLLSSDRSSEVDASD